LALEGTIRKQAIRLKQMEHSRQQTILVAGNNSADAFLLRRAFRKAELPYQLRFVNDGQEVLSYLQGTAPYTDRDIFPKPQLLLLDLDMPNMNGFEVLRWLQSSVLFDYLPVVVLSTSDVEGDKALAGKLGARGYYVKSARAAEVVKMFEELGKQWLDPNLPTGESI